MEVNLQIPGITNYNEDVLLLVIPTMTYSEMVPVMVSSKIIDRALSIMTKEELAKATMMWSCHVWVSAAIPHKLEQIWSGRGSKSFLSKWCPCRGEEVLPQ